MHKDFLIDNAAAARLYDAAKTLPIVDYHCHLSVQEIYEDRPFTDLAQMWLTGDHYKWRLMRACGIPEEQITGTAEPYAKFLAYAKAISLSAGNPLYHWTMMELDRYFGISEQLCPQAAPDIWTRANQVIWEQKLSPRKLIADSNVEYIATTDDPAIPLGWHDKLAADERFGVQVAPSFRADRLANLQAADFPAYMYAFGQAAGTDIRSLADFEAAVRTRLDDFCAHHCRFADIGISAFPQGACDRATAEELFCRALAGEALSDAAQRTYLAWLYPFLAKEYRTRGMVMQLHLSVIRNANSPMYAALGPDCGGDCAGDPIPVTQLVAFLDRVECDGGLPRTILYTLDPSMYLPMATAAGSFSGVTLGAAWWFCDHRAGIEQQLMTYAQTSSIAQFSGMLTDSRSFLSYARHDYFRRILCSLLGGWIESGTFPDEAAAGEIVYKVCYQNSKSLSEGRIQ